MDILTFLFQKMTFLKNHLGTCCDFHKPLEKFSKFLNPSTSWNELAAPRTLQMIKNGPQLKKSGHPCYILYSRSKSYVHL
jgi:hypothetical protein